MLKHVAALSFLMMLSGCGGGSADSQPPVPPAPDLLLSAENYQEATPIAFAFQEALLQLSYYSYDRIQSLTEAQRNKEIVCSNGGTRSVDWTGTLSAQSQVTATTVVTETFRDCMVSEFGEVINGKAITQVKADSTETNLRLRLDFSGLTISSLPKIVVVDPFDLNINQSADIYTMTPGLVNNKLRFNFEGDGTYSLSNTKLIHQLDTKTALYTTSFQTDLAVEGFKSGLHIATSTNFAGYIGEYPHEGVISLSDSKGNKLEVKANYVENSAFANIAFNGLGSDNKMFWNDLIEGNLWSWPGLNYGYATEFRANNFAFSGYYQTDKLSRLNPGDKIVLQFSRELAPSQQLDLVFQGDWSAQNLELEYQIKGSQLILTVPEGMKQQQEYRLSFFNLISAKGYQLQFTDWQFFKANDAVQAKLSASTEVFTASNYPVLSAAGSVSKTNLQLKYSWAEVTNTGLVFTTPDAAETSFYYPGAFPQEKPSVKVTVTDSQGNSSSEILQLSPYTAGLDTLYFKSDQGDYIGQGKTVLHQTQDSILRNFTIADQWNSIRAYLSYKEDNQYFDWNLSFSAPNGLALTAGHYSGATRYPFQSLNTPGLDFTGNGRGCNTSKGEFTIHEISYSGDEGAPVLNTLALDLIQYCEGGSTKIQASVRLNSTVPLQF